MYSLRRRLLVSSTLLLLVFLGAIGFGLNRAFESSVLSAAQDALRSQVMLLLSAVDVVDGEVVPPLVLSEPRLQQQDSDLFAQIQVPKRDQAPEPIQGPDNLRANATPQEIIWRSASLLDQQLPLVSSGLADFDFNASQSWEGRSVNVTSLSVDWETEDGMVPFLVQVAESDAVYKRRLARYQQQVGLWLVFFGGALIVLLLGMLGWALKPLERVRRQVNEIEEGRRKRLDEDYPMEVSRLTQNLNQLLNFEEQRIERHREVLGNLAHSLKTPIAVLKGLQYRSEIKPEADDQLAAMQTIIDYQLQSASAVGRRRFSQAVEIDEATKKIVHSLEKLHQDKALKISISMDKGTLFYGDEGDWMEVVGNLCDNAFKWSASRVDINVKALSHEKGQSLKTPIQVVVQDDGPGIDDELKASIMQRGVRLDTQTPGHGLGMHIVKGLVEAYEGSLDISKSDFDSGTKFTVVLN